MEYIHFVKNHQVKAMKDAETTWKRALNSDSLSYEMKIYKATREAGSDTYT